MPQQRDATARSMAALGRPGRAADRRPVRHPVSQGEQERRERLYGLMQLHGIRPRASAASRSPPTATTICRLRPICWTGSSTWPSPTGSGRATSLHSYRRRLAVPGRSDRPVQPPGGGLVTARGHDARHRHRRAAHGLVQSASGQAGWTDLSQPQRQRTRSQLVVATLLCSVERSGSLNAFAGVRQPSVLRGLVFNARATARVKVVVA